MLLKGTEELLETHFNFCRCSVHNYFNLKQNSDITFSKHMKGTQLLFCMGLQMCVVHQHILQVSSIPGLTVGESPSIILFYYFYSCESVR